MQKGKSCKPATPHKITRRVSPTKRLIPFFEYDPLPSNFSLLPVDRVRSTPKSRITAEIETSLGIQLYSVTLSGSRVTKVQRVQKFQKWNKKAVGWSGRDKVRRDDARRLAAYSGTRATRRSVWGCNTQPRSKDLSSSRLLNWSMRWKLKI